MTKIALLSEFSESFEKVHKEIVQDLADHFGFKKTLELGYPSHVTLKYWFEVNDDQIKQVEEIVQDFLNNIVENKLQISGFSGFYPKFIFLQVKFPSETYKEFEKLQKKLKEKEWIKFIDFDYPNNNFHSTICQDCDEKYEEILDYLNDKYNDVYNEEFLENITIYKSNGIKDGSIIGEKYKSFYKN